MKKKTPKITLYFCLFIVGFVSFVLQVFVFSSPNGFGGFLLCLMSIYLMMGSIYKLCKLSERVKNLIFTILDLLFFIR